MFVFTLLLVDLLFESYIVTSFAALILNFLPFAFIYTFAGYRYPMAMALAVVSLYFLHLGFRTGSRFHLSLGGIAAGLCLASSISGKQYLLGLVIAAPVYAAFYWKSLSKPTTWNSIAVVVYGFVAAAMPILLYIAFNRDAYTYYEDSFVRDFWRALHSAAVPRRCPGVYRPISGLLFHYPRSSLLHPGYFAYPAGVLLVACTRIWAIRLAEAL